MYRTRDALEWARALLTRRPPRSPIDIHRGCLSGGGVVALALWNRFAFTALWEISGYHDHARIPIYVAVPSFAALLIAMTAVPLGLPVPKSRSPTWIPIAILVGYSAVALLAAGLPIAFSGCANPEPLGDVAVGVSVWPISEEAVFRLGGHAALRHLGLPPGFRICAVAVAFTLYHVPQAAASSYLDIWLTGLFFGSIYEIFGSLRLNIALHMAVNAIIPGAELIGYLIGLPSCPTD